MLQSIKDLLDKSDMSSEDKSYVLASLWTHEQTPAITSEAEYELYAETVRQLEKALPDRSDPEFTRSPQGMMATSFVARMIEWEETVVP
jgi:hypothetical protein